MNCQDFWISLYVADAPDRGHLQQCPVCADAWARHRAVADGLRALAEVQRGAQAPERIEQRLVAAFRNHAGHALASQKPRRFLIWTWAPAAATLAVVAILLLQAGSIHEPYRADSDVMLHAAAEPVRSLPAGFIPLPNAAQVGPNEEVNLVRLEVSRAAIVALGIEVSADASDAVEADVMLGYDGLARAVRLLDE